MEFLSPLSHTDTKMVPKGFVFSLPPSLSRWTSWPWVFWSVLLFFVMKYMAQWAQTQQYIPHYVRLFPFLS